jgi:hypothetical protein
VVTNTDWFIARESAFDLPHRGFAQRKGDRATKRHGRETSVGAHLAKNGFFDHAPTSVDIGWHDPATI